MLVWPGCIRYGFPLVLIGIAHSALLQRGYEFISDEIQGVCPCEAKPLSPNKSFTACKKEIYLIHRSHHPALRNIQLFHVRETLAEYHLSVR